MAEITTTAQFVAATRVEKPEMTKRTARRWSWRSIDKKQQHPVAGIMNALQGKNNSNYKAAASTFSNTIHKDTHLEFSIKIRCYLFVKSLVSFLLLFLLFSFFFWEKFLVALLFCFCHCCHFLFFFCYIGIVLFLLCVESYRDT